MRFVYATRPLPKLEFATTNQRDAIPEEAQVFAVCDGAMTIRQQDARSSATLTDQEQMALEQLIVESQESEATRADTNNQIGAIRRLLVRWLNL